jgi:hypothetical protein
MENPNAARVTIDHEMPRLTEGMTERSQQRLRDQADAYSLRPMFLIIRRLVHDQGATFEQADAQVQEWVANGMLPMRFVPDFHRQIPLYIEIRDWHAIHRPVFRPDQREAQLAADSQNVHTREITQQMYSMTEDDPRE